MTSSSGMFGGPLPRTSYKSICLRCGLLFIAGFVAVALALSPRALATCATGDGNVEPGTCTNPQNLSASNATGTVSSGATLTTGLETAYTISGTSSTLLNNGTIESQVSGALGGTVSITGTGDTITNNGSILNSASSGEGVSIVSNSQNAVASVTNSGTIGAGMLAFNVTGNILNTATGQINGAGSGTGVGGLNVEGELGGNFTNSGTISTLLLNNANGAVQFGSIGGSFLNAKGATITASDAGNGTLIAAVDMGSTTGSIGGNFENDGTISSPTSGAVNVEGAIAGNFTNTGTISSGGNAAAVTIGNGLQGSFTNSGTISATLLSAGSNINSLTAGGGVTAVVDGSFTNSGTIQGTLGALIGLQNNAPLTNSGTINGSLYGLFLGSGVFASNTGGAPTNLQPTQSEIVNTSTGLIEQTGGAFGATVCNDFQQLLQTAGFSVPCAAVLSTGTNTGVFVNRGTISANFGPAVALFGGTFTIPGSGNSPAQTFTVPANLNLTNTGTITGGSGVAIDYRQGTLPSTITQAGGAINGSILLSPAGDTVDITGGVINGGIVGNSAVNGANAGTVNFALGSGGAFTTGGDFDVANVNIDSGTVLLANDITVFNAVTNNAGLQVNIAGGPRTITGNYTQTGTGTLTMEVSPGGAAQLNVTKTASLGGALALVYDPGTYTARDYTLLQAGAVTGQFASFTSSGVNPGLTQTLGYDPTSVELCLGTSGCTQSLVVAPTNASMFAATTDTLIMQGQQATSTILDRLGERLSGGEPGAVAALDTGLPGVAQLADAGGNNLGTLSNLVAALPDAVVQYGGWLRASGNFASFNGNSVAPGFTAQNGGFLAGLDRPVAPGLVMGGAVGYSHTDLDEHSTSGGDIDTVRLAGYGGGWYGPSLLTATVGYAHDWIDTSRGFASAGTALESHGGNEATVAGQWAVPTALPTAVGDVTVTPRAGVQYLHLSEDGFDESGAGGLDLSSPGLSSDSLQPYVGAAVSRRFTTAGGTEITPELRASYSHEVMSNNHAWTVAALDGTTFLASGVLPSRDMVTLGIGVTARAQQNVYLYASYDTVVYTGNTTDQMVSAGLKMHF